MSAGTVVGLLIAGLVVLQVGWPLWRRRRRTRWHAEGLDETQREVIERTIPLVAAMPQTYRKRFEGLVRQFIHEKDFVGCNGLVVEPEHRLIIAAQACLLLLNRPGGCYDDLQTILVYPDAFIVEHDELDADGLVHAGRDLRTGESWDDGRVIVSWSDVIMGADNPDDAYNVVIHEFAHQLDGQSGLVNGAPSIVREELAAHWPERMRREFDALRGAVERGVHTFIDPYGASSPAEFFAVLSEVFFEMPAQLQRRHPVLYECLDAVYDLDPARWS
ncbi:MAG: M90 family metallopeptidase [Pseudomonadota bacterium]